MGIEGPSHDEDETNEAEANLETQPNELETALEEFKLDLEAAVMHVQASQFRFPLEMLENSFAALEGHPVEMTAALKEKFGVDPGAQPVEEHSFDAPEEATYKGQTHVKVFATNEDDVYLGEYTFPNGDVSWCVRPLELLPDDVE